MSCVWGCYDNDGHPVFFLTQFGRNVLYHNNRDGTFTDVTDRAGVAGLESGAFHSGGIFEEVGQMAGMALTGQGQTMAAMLLLVLRATTARALGLIPQAVFQVL